MYGSTHVKVQRTSVKRIGSALSHLVRHDDSDLEDKEEESEDDDVAACMWICVSQYENVCMHMHICIYTNIRTISPTTATWRTKRRSLRTTIYKNTHAYIDVCMYIYRQMYVNLYRENVYVCI